MHSPLNRWRNASPQPTPRQYLPDCPDRTGGIGDWRLANDVLWVIIDDLANQNFVSPTGGTLVDAGLVGRDGEQLVSDDAAREHDA